MEREDRKRGRGGVNYVAVVGLLFVVLIVVALVNMLRSQDSGTIGIGDFGIGKPLPRFAVPDAASGLEGDANVDPSRACRLRGADVITVCSLFGRPSVISFWFTRGASECLGDQDVFDRVATGFGNRINALSIDVRDDRDEVRDLIAEHGWQVPVGYDRDGAVSNLYRVGGCPTFVFSYPDGRIRKATIGRAGVDGLKADIRSLIDASHRRSRQRAPA